jgi:hypothetical protein
VIFHKVIGDGPAKIAVIHGWFGDHRIEAFVGAGK